MSFRNSSTSWSVELCEAAGACATLCRCATPLNITIAVTPTHTKLFRIIIAILLLKSARTPVGKHPANKLLPALEHFISNLHEIPNPSPCLLSQWTAPPTPQGRMPRIALSLLGTPRL